MKEITEVLSQLAEAMTTVMTVLFRRVSRCKFHQDRAGVPDGQGNTSLEFGHPIQFISTKIFDSALHPILNPR